jgi:hypothetical protein
MRPQIKVEKVSEAQFQVMISGTPDPHTVTLSQQYYMKLTAGKMPVAELVKRSFEFLLAREPEESILTEFDLPVIARYFPEYEREMQREAGIEKPEPLP